MDIVDQFVVDPCGNFPPTIYGEQLCSETISHIAVVVFFTMILLLNSNFMILFEQTAIIIVHSDMMNNKLTAMKYSSIHS